MKPLLDPYRVLLTGIYLMRTGTVVANLVTFNLVDRKVSGPEKGALLCDAPIYREALNDLACENPTPCVTSPPFPFPPNGPS